MDGNADATGSAGAAARPIDWRRMADEAVLAVGTPCYVAAWSPAAAALDRLAGLRSRVPVYSWLSFKTHPVPALAAAWIRAGGGVEVVSESELITILELGCPVDRVLVNGVAKHAWLRRHELRRMRVHFDSVNELDDLLDVAVDDRWRVGVRCHVPDERDARDSAFGGQFGMSPTEAVGSLRRLIDAGADCQSVHFHLGQRRHRAGAFTSAMAHVVSLCKAASFEPRVIDGGGSLPAWGDPDCDAAFDDLREALRAAERAFPRLSELWLENGRYVTGPSAVLAIRVLDIKERDECRYLICDGGRTNHALAADERKHQLLVPRERSAAPRLTTVCGPTCMTDDQLGRFELPGDVAVGDVLVWLDAGAYHLPWETRFSHGLNAVAWYDEDGQLAVVRRREPPEAWSRLWTDAPVRA